MNIMQLCLCDGRHISLQAHAVLNRTDHNAKRNKASSLYQYATINICNYNAGTLFFKHYNNAAWLKHFSCHHGVANYL